MMPHWLVSASALIMTALLAACGASKQEQQMIDSLTKDMETHCVGRHLIDLPTSFKPLHDNSVKLYYGKDKDYTDTIVTVLREGISKNTFELRVLYEADNIAKELRDDYKTSMLISNTKLSDTAYMLRFYDDSSLDGAFNSSLFIYVGDSVVKLYGEVYKSDPAIMEARLKKTASQIRPFTDPEKAGRGFCMGHIVIDGDHDFEQAFTLNFFSDTWKDVTWEIDSTSLGSGDEGLLKRWKERQSGFEAMTGGAASPVFHSGKITVGNMPGEELLAELKDYGKLGFSFSAESLTKRSRPGFERPTFSVDMDTGSSNASNKEDAVDSSWSKEEALGVWNAVIKSIRLRPGAL